MVSINLCQHLFVFKGGLYDSPVTIKLTGELVRMPYVQTAQGEM